jgi:NifU-like protein involved in Fe-S cluster formation
MDEAVIKYYRGLLRNGFQYAGSWENPSIFINSVGENLPICGSLSRDYVHVFINMQGQKVKEIKYLCTCDPAANVIFEIMCSLIEGKTIAEIKNIKPEAFSDICGSRQTEFLKRVGNALELLNRGFKRYLGGQTT